MRRSTRSSLGIVLLALVVGFGAFALYIRYYGVPPKLTDRLMRSRLGQPFAQGLLRATAPAPPPGVHLRGPGDRLPDWTLPDIDGQSQPLAQWKGRPLLINFWATWCVPCRREMPALAAAQRTHDDVRIVGIAMDDPHAVRAYLHARAVNYPILLGDGVRPDPRAVLGNTRLALPFSVLVDAQGRIVRTRLGPLDEADLERWLR